VGRIQQLVGTNDAANQHATNAKKPSMPECATSIINGKPRVEADMTDEERKEKKRKYDRKRRARPEYKAADAKHKRELYAANPVLFRARAARSRALPGAKAKQTKYDCEYRAKNTTLLKKKSAKHRAANRALLRDRSAKNRALPGAKAKAIGYNRHRYARDPSFKLKTLLRNRLRSAIKNKSRKGSAVKLLGCTIDELLVYFEGLFTKGQTWANHGLWHIDHVLPLASFDLEDPAQLAIACHYTNLQPLWAFDNLSKNNKIL